MLTLADAVTSWRVHHPDGSQTEAQTAEEAGALSTTKDWISVNLQDASDFTGLAHSCEILAARKETVSHYLHGLTVRLVFDGSLDVAAIQAMLEESVY